MKERPIIFSGPMVRAILEGQKTMTRRILKPQPKGNPYFNRGLWRDPGELIVGTEIKCPYGQPGNRLRVKETWNGTQGEGVAYRATEPDMNGEPWKPSILMPRKYSRITLEIIRIGIERLQEISEEDAKKEGFGWIGHSDGEEDPLYRLAQYWDKLNGKGAWESNPWVWVIEFKVMEIKRQIEGGQS
jgi:hypothetical protein